MKPELSMGGLMSRSADVKARASDRASGTRQWPTARSTCAVATALAITALAMSGVKAARAQDRVDADESTRLGEIVVTARKRAENIRDVPISLTSLSGKEIAEMGAGDFRELDGRIPNMVQVGLESNVSPTISIRGISSDSRNSGFESGSSVYVDGVYTGRPVSWSSELVDVESFEVLRGPQGSLFGKNTIAGAINITTRKPDKEFRALGEIEGGNFQLMRARGSVSGPLGSDRVLGGLALYKTEREGFQTNVVNNADYWNKNDYGGRAQLRFLPNDALDVILAVDGLRERLRMNVNSVTSGLGALPDPREVGIDAPVFSERDIYGASLTANYTFANGMTLTSISAERWNDIEFLSDDDASPVPILFSQSKDNEEQFTQELRLASPDVGRFKYVVGLYYYDQEVRTDRGSVAPAGGLAPVELSVALNGVVNTHDYAIFAQADFAATERLIFTLGGRYTDEQKTLDFELFGLPPFGIITISPTQHYTQSDEDFSPTGSLLYRFNDSVNGYVTVSRGYKGGGFNADFVGNPDLAFDPETVINYEAGLKALAFEGRLRANLAAFFMDYKDLQVSVFSPLGGFIIDNAASATIKGAELDLVAEPWSNFEFMAGVGYNDAEFDEFGTNSGNRVPFAPKFTAGTAAQYRFRAGNAGSITLRGEYNYRSDYFVAAANNPSDKVDGYGLLNARITFATQDERYQVQAWVENLQDKLYINDRGAPIGGLLGSESVVYGKPRTYGVQLSAQF